jgi:hypothetical protein
MVLAVHEAADVPVQQAADTPGYAHVITSQITENERPIRAVPAKIEAPDSGHGRESVVNEKLRESTIALRDSVGVASPHLMSAYEATRLSMQHMSSPVRQKTSTLPLSQKVLTPWLSPVIVQMHDSIPS